MLTELHVTHSSRNTLYTQDGTPRSVTDANTAPNAFELVHTHPIIRVASDGMVEQVAQSETKRGVSALPYDVFHEFMAAYKSWMTLCESEQFMTYFDWPEGSVVVTNNWRVLHGRATIPRGMPRTMCTGYLNKAIVENRYRLLQQEQARNWLDNDGNAACKTNLVALPDDMLRLLK